MINDLNIIPVKTASCSVMGDYAIKQKANVPWGKKKVGDVVLYDFNNNGTSDHTGIIEAINKDGTITVIEGNTSLKSNDNGGNVMRRTRYKSQVNYFVRPKYDDKVTPQMVIAVARSQLGTKEKPKNSNNVIYNTWYYGHAVSGSAYPWCMTFVEWCFAHVFTKIAKPNPTYAGTIPKPTIKYGSKGTGAKQLQQFLAWYGIKTNTDGEFGNSSVSSLMQFQFNEGLTVDGEFGKKSYTRALSYTQKKTDAPTATTDAPIASPQKPSQPVSSTLGKCIDVSYWQGKISVSNWKKIKNVCEYAICRASFTSLSKFALDDDSTFASNVKNAKEAGIKHIGAYHFSQALSVAEAQKEAKFLCDILDKHKASINFWVACDYETNAKGRLNGKTVSTKASDIANAFCAVVEKRGYAACIYANYTMLTKYLKAPKYPIWLAQYNKTKSYNKNVVMWQYTSSGKVSGIDKKDTNNKSANVDLSYVYGLPVKKTVENATKPQTPAATTPTATAKKGYTGKFPSENNNQKIVNGMAYRMCYPYGTPQKKYTYKDGKPTASYKANIDKVYPKHKEWPNKKQKVGACCDVFTGVELGLVGIHVPKDLKNQLVEMPKMTKQLKSNGHYKASDFKLGDVVQRGRKDKSGHTWIVCELVNGKKFVANAHYKHLGGCYAVMDAKPKNIVKSKWAYYKCYTVLGAVRKYYVKGDYGYDVLYIQRFLNWYGIKVTEDGDFGEKTEAAVKKFQKAVGINPGGQVGTKTIAAMKKVKK